MEMHPPPPRPPPSSQAVFTGLTLHGAMSVESQKTSQNERGVKGG